MMQNVTFWKMLSFFQISISIQKSTRFDCSFYAIFLSQTRVICCRFRFLREFKQAPHKNPLCRIEFLRDFNRLQKKPFEFYIKFNINIRLKKDPEMQISSYIRIKKITQSSRHAVFQSSF